MSLIRFLGVKVKTWLAVSGTLIQKAGSQLKGQSAPRTPRTLLTWLLFQSARFLARGISAEPTIEGLNQWNATPNHDVTLVVI